jgi:hypothetical protein
MTMAVKSIGSLFFFFLAVISLYGQQQQQGWNLDDHVLIKMSQQSIFQEVTTYEGTPYLNEEFMNGDVFINNGRYKNVLLRYNIYKDFIEFKKDSRVYALDPSKKIQKVVFGENIFVVEELVFRGKKTLAYLQRLDSGKAELMKRSLVSYREPQPPKPIETQGKPARFSPLPDTFFFRVAGGELHEIESLKKLIEAFPDKHDELNAFAGKEKISIRKEDELIQLIRYYNTL